jgi:uncharacterized protein YecT (DUF1311 family)
MTTLPTIDWNLIASTRPPAEATAQILHCIRNGDDMMTISSRFPELSAAQVCLAKKLQAQDAELNRLYQELQHAESLKLELEHALTTTLLRR